MRAALKCRVYQYHQEKTGTIRLSTQGDVSGLPPYKKTRSPNSSRLPQSHEFLHTQSFCRHTPSVAPYTAIFLELVMPLLVGTVDKIMVANDHSATAINQANSILDMLTVSLSVLSAASLILISQYKGSRDKEREDQVYVLSFYFNLTVSLLLGIILTVFAKPILSSINVQKEIMDEALIYLRITGSGLFLQATMLSLSAFLRSNTYMKQCLLVSFLFNIINISGNALFLYVLEIPGALGVAIPSVMARLLGGPHPSL